MKIYSKKSKLKVKSQTKTILDVVEQKNQESGLNHHMEQQHIQKQISQQKSNKQSKPQVLNVINTEEQIVKFIERDSQKKKQSFHPWQKYEIEKYVECLKQFKDQLNWKQIMKGQIFETMEDEINKDYKKYRPAHDIKIFHKKMLAAHQSVDNIIANAVEKGLNLSQKKKKFTKNTCNALAHFKLDPKIFTSFLKKSHVAYQEEEKPFSTEDFMFINQNGQLTLAMHIIVQEQSLTDQVQPSIKMQVQQS